MEIQFQDYQCLVDIDKYSNGRIRIALYDIEDEMPVATATCNVDLPNLNNSLPLSYVFIKDYAENEGLLEALVKAKIVVPLGITIFTGYTKLRLCKILKIQEDELQT